MKQRQDSRAEGAKETVIKRLKDMNQQLMRDYGVARIGVFGSYARGEEKKGSDIDLLVEFTGPINLFEFSRLKRFLTEQLGIPVDLVTPGALKPLIKDQILQSTAYI